MAPPLQPASVDVVSNRNVIWTLLDPRKAFRNWFALLRPGGRILAVDRFEAQHGSDHLGWLALTAMKPDR